MAYKKRKDGYRTKYFTVEGKRYCVYGHNAQELNEKERTKREELQKGIYKRKNPTIKEYHAEWTKRREKSVKETTLRAQEQIFNTLSAIQIPNAKRTFGEMRIRDITLSDLVTLQTELSKTCITRTVNDYMSHLKHVMKDARAEKLIDEDIWLAYKPLRRTEEHARDTYHRALTEREQKLFFECEHTKKSSYYNVYCLGILTGMRIGEIGALRYSDIQNDMIHIERTVTRSRDGGYRIGDGAKTKAGKRQIPINREIREVINRQKVLNRMQYGNHIQIDDTIFKAPEGGLLLATPIDREMKKISKELEIQPFTFHAFRATFCTRAIESGIDPKTLQELVGHQSFNLTMSLYTHVLDERKAKAMNALNIAVV